MFIEVNDKTSIKMTAGRIDLMCGDRSQLTQAEADNQS